MLDGTSRPTNPDYEPDGILQEGGAASPAAMNPIPLPRASLSFLVKQPGGLGCKLHSKCSKKTTKIYRNLRRTDTTTADLRVSEGERVQVGARPISGTPLLLLLTKDSRHAAVEVVDDGPSGQR